MNENLTDAERDDLLRRIRLLSLDVDGVLTDGGIYYADDGNTYRKFNAKDGMGMVRLQAGGVPIAIISAGRKGAIQFRADRLKVAHVFTDVENKLETLKALAAQLGVDMAEVGHMGDDVNDLPLMHAVGCPISVADAMAEVKTAARIVTAKGGGRGAVREICDAILQARDTA